MKKALIVLVALLCAGCATTDNYHTSSVGVGGNRDYARNCGYAMDELLLCGPY